MFDLGRRMGRKRMGRRRVERLRSVSRGCSSFHRAQTGPSRSGQPRSSTFRVTFSRSLSSEIELAPLASHFPQRRPILSPFPFSSFVDLDIRLRVRSRSSIDKGRRMILLHAWGFVDVEETSVLVVDGRRGSVALVTTMSAKEEEGKKEGEESDDTSSDSSSDDGGVAVR
jgi:hypothetical protein